MTPVKAIRCCNRLNFTEHITDRWQQPGDITTYPVLTMDPNTYGASTPWINTDMWLHDGSYLRFRNLSLAYNIPQQILKEESTARSTFR